MFVKCIIKLQGSTSFNVPAAAFFLMMIAIETVFIIII